ncbi:geranylgeranyl diphosphate synthase type I [Nonomuraea thailandensis]|uniref:Geranylgeranyl diphosphate synthase type I n=1 Tax=Nonomuraea thailandensis TaxID=1188745 RepID=A0A9X2K2S0_9ACTN|nr:polyprenyl synthetase family protein [Nonomuraea thailandensis]MCP2357370.1 geranylgeranyl diphosphate synthase type I [Nonomuraea thailandensis]
MTTSRAHPSTGTCPPPLLSRARELTEPVLRTLIDGLPGRLRRVAGYHMGWWDTEGRPAGHSGKCLRPALVLACAQASSDLDAAAAPPVLAAAAAVELVHDYSLLHDDVLDGDRTRRHRPTAWSVFGINQAILTGDTLMALAMQQVAIGKAALVLSRAVQELCEGQSADLAFETRDDVTVAECLAMAEQKTGALTGAACELGALTAGADETVAAAYGRFGRDFGMTMQLTDDLLGIWGDPSVTGKPAGADLISRKKTLPVMAALESGTPVAERLAGIYHDARELDADGLAQVKRLIEAAGGRDWVRAEIARRTRAALAALAEVGPTAAGSADLLLLIDMAGNRDH